MAAVAWGLVAERVGLQTTLLIGAGGLLLSLGTGFGWKLSLGDSASLGPYGLLPALVFPPVLDPTQSRGLVVLEYQIADLDRVAFLELMETVSEIRQRNGVTQWGVYEDIAKPGRWHEQFIIDTLAEMEVVRQHTTTADHLVLQQVYALHQGSNGAPLLTRYLAAPAFS